MKALSRKKKSADVSATAPPNPYADAQHVWIERYGTYIQQAYNWRLLAMLLAIALIAAVVGLIYVASQTKFVPYVVAIDKVGSAFAVAPADKAGSVDERVVHAELGQFIVYARTITADRALEQTALANAFNFVAPQSQAFGFLSDYYPHTDPFKRSETETVQVRIGNVLPISPTTYTIQWTEEVRGLNGKTLRTENWEANATTEIRAAGDEQSILKNPIGLFITNLVWEKKQ